MEQVFIADLDNPIHADAVVYLLNEYSSDEMGAGKELAAEVKANLVPELKKRPHVFAVLAFEDSTPAGLALCVEGFSSFACKPLVNIHDVIVPVGFRGKGISKRLLEKVEAVAIERGCCKLTLEVLEGNEIAKNAYLSFGFEGYVLDEKNGRALFWQKKLA